VYAALIAEFGRELVCAIDCGSRGESEIRQAVVMNLWKRLFP
jgi:hypothetical protein